MSDAHALAHEYTPVTDGCQSATGAVADGLAPGSSNTPVQITSKGLSLDGTLILDWLSGTFVNLEQTDALAIVELLFGELTPVDGGWGGYEHQAIILGKGWVRWSDERPQLGVHVALGAEALAHVALLGGLDEQGCVREWLGKLLGLGFRPSRADFALDDRAGLLQMERIREHIASGNLSTRFRQINAFENLRGSKGSTVYFGSGKSSTVCRIYDKAAEQDVEGHWMRCEFQFRHKNAVRVCEKVVEDGEACLFGLFRGYLDFKEGTTGDRNVTRQKSASWWIDFLGDAVKCALGLPRVKRTIAEIKHWVFKQIAPTLALLTMAEQGCVDWLYEALRDGRRRIPKHRLALLGPLEPAAQYCST